MKLNKKIFPLHHNASLSFLRLTNITTFEDADAVLIDFNTFVDLSDDVVSKFINCKKTIYIDGTYEVLENLILEKLDKFPKVDGVHYFCNPKNDAHTRTLLLKLIKKGLVCAPIQYFVKYSNIYQPDITAIPMPKKSYLCLTGKINPSRTFLIALLSKYNLLQHGHVSYFGENYIDKKFDNQTIDNYKTASYLSSQAKGAIDDEMKKLKLPLVVDTKQFNPKISHTKTFNAELYSAVEFVIVPETTGCTINGNFFPTEKTIKCINLNKKFIPVASKGFVRNLKNYYKNNFNKDISNLTDWCDTSFDELSSLEERIKRVVKVTANEISKYNK